MLHFQVYICVYTIDTQNVTFASAINWKHFLFFYFWLASHLLTESDTSSDAEPLSLLESESISWWFLRLPMTIAHLSGDSCQKLIISVFDLIYLTALTLLAVFRCFRFVGSSLDILALTTLCTSYSSEDERKKKRTHTQSFFY